MYSPARSPSIDTGQLLFYPYFGAVWLAWGGGLSSHKKSQNLRQIQTREFGTTAFQYVGDIVERVALDTRFGPNSTTGVGT